MVESRDIFSRNILVMGVLNVTEDSFSDGGRYVTVERAAARAVEMAEEGADILDIGGESSRPGSDPVSVDEELRRVVPAVAAATAQTDVMISVDTVKPAVAEAALAAGAAMINDVSNLRDGDELARIAARFDAHLVLMHSRGTPRTMAGLTQYKDVAAEVRESLSASARRAEAAGMSPDKIWLDPGLGFAKTAAQSFELIARLDELVALGYPVLVGPSRKSFVGERDGAPVTRRTGGSAAAVAASVLMGARAVRVHDVREMRQAAYVAKAVADARPHAVGGEVAHV